MKTRASILLLVGVLATAVGARSQTSDLYEIKVEKVKEGIYLAYRPDPLRPFVEGNVTIIVNERDVVLVDAGGSPQTARRTIAELKKLTPNPVRHVIYTHIHRDHRFGSQEYAKAFPGVEFISHPATRDIIAGSGQKFVADTVKRLESQGPSGEAEVERLRRENRPGNEKVIAHLRRYYERDIHTMLEDYREITNVAPTSTFERKLTLHRGARSIELLFLGKGDTPHDVVVYLPHDKVVCSGDMVVHPIPYGFSEEPTEWLKTLGKLSELDFDALIPGHGEVQTGKAYLRRLMSLLGSVQAQVGDGIRAGLEFEELRKRVDVAGFEDAFAGDDPVRRYYFRIYLTEPLIERTFKEMKAKAVRP